MKGKREKNPAFRKLRRLRKLAGLITAASICTQFLSGFGGFPAFAEETADDFGNITVIAPQPDIGRDEFLPAFDEPDAAPLYSFPDNMRGVYVTPTVDYAVPNEDGEPLTEEQISAGVSEMLDTAEKNGLNSIIIMTDRKGEIFYSADMNEIIEKAVHN